MHVHTRTNFWKIHAFSPFSLPQIALSQRLSQWPTPCRPEFECFPYLPQYASKLVSSRIHVIETNCSSYFSYFHQILELLQISSGHFLSEQKEHTKIREACWNVKVVAHLKSSLFVSWLNERLFLGCFAMHFGACWHRPQAKFQSLVTS